MEVRKERSGWRDLDFSEHHRTWGWDCPAVDIDFLMIEYDHAKPYAIVEYKNERAKPADPNHPSFRAIRLLCDLARISFFGVRYSSDFLNYKVVPLNGKAKSFLPSRKEMTEDEYKKFLFIIRN